MLDSILMTNSVGFQIKRFRDKREKLFRSQYKFSDAIKEQEGVDVGQSHISAIERGERQPSVDLLPRLARVLETNTDFLLGLTDDDAPHSDLADQVVAGVKNEREREIMQELVDLILPLPIDGKRQLVDVIKMLRGTGKPRIIGDEE